MRVVDEHAMLLIAYYNVSTFRFIWMQFRDQMTIFDTCDEGHKNAVVVVVVVGRAKTMGSHTQRTAAPPSVRISYLVE